MRFLLAVIQAHCVGLDHVCIVLLVYNVLFVYLSYNWFHLLLIYSVIFLKVMLFASALRQSVFVATYD